MWDTCFYYIVDVDGWVIGMIEFSTPSLSNIQLFLYFVIQRVLSEHLLPEVLQSLLEVSHTGCQDLSEQTNKVNIRKDAENLRYCDL